MKYTNKSIRVHSKCLCILEMIQKVNNRIESFKAELHDYDNAKPFDIIRLVQTRSYIASKIQRSQEVKDRLVIYYASTMHNLVTPILQS